MPPLERDESCDFRKVEDNNTPNVSDKWDNRISAESGDNGNENRRRQINRRQREKVPRAVDMITLRFALRHECKISSEISREMSGTPL